MKKKIIDGSMTNIAKHYNYDEVKMAEIKYGLESLYLTITKTIVIFFISYLIGTIEILIWIMVLYTLLRIVGFGLHAKKSWQCWIGSLITFLLVPYLCVILNISVTIKIIVSLCCLILIIKYAPADTEKRPIVSQLRRKIYKTICSGLTIAYIFVILLCNNNLVENVFMFSILIETFMILPISYKIFRLSYDNYKTYLASHKLPA